jgi:hypothetical protein
MHTFAYRVKLRPTLAYVSELTAESLGEVLAADAKLRCVEHPVVEVGLQRDSHLEAVNELLAGVQRLGYDFAEGVVVKVADRALEMAFGLGTTTGLGVAASKQAGETAFVASLIAWGLGLLVGANMENVEVIAQLRWTNAGWQFVATRPQTQVHAAAEPA